MAQSKALSKGSPENKSIESTNSDNKSSGSTSSDSKSAQSTSTSNIWTTNNDAADDKTKSQSNGRLNLLFHFIHSLFNNYI